ncbi:MAG: histidine kinase, partial [Chloroflexus sp.]
MNPTLSQWLHTRQTAILENWPDRNEAITGNVVIQPRLETQRLVSALIATAEGNELPLRNLFSEWIAAEADVGLPVMVRNFQNLHRTVRATLIQDTSGLT